MNAPSDEQFAIISSLKERKSVIVDAVAGSGKTTTVLGLAKYCADKKILQITYNSQLKIEVRNKVLGYGLRNIDVHTYHSLCVCYYDSQAHTDDRIVNVVNSNKAPCKKLPKYDIIVIDETQDMTRLYYIFINKFIYDLGNSVPNLSVLILGDKFQGVYEFKGSDSRFLTRAHGLWDHRVDFLTLSLKRSYRVTNQIAKFVNEVMIGHDRIYSNKEGPKVKYIIHNIKEIKHTLKHMIKDYFNKGYKPSDIFVLSASVKNSNPALSLENELVEDKIPCFVARSDCVKLDKDLVKNKVVFSSFHQAKGRERPIVIVYGFDSSYFKFYAKQKPSNVCPPDLYVAVTRASDILILAVDKSFDPLPFLNLDRLRSSDYLEVMCYISHFKMRNDLNHHDHHKISVTELTKFLNETTLWTISPIINSLFKVVSPPKDMIQIPLKINFGQTTEDVSDINGIAIPSLYEYQLRGNCNIYHVAQMYSKYFNFIKSEFDMLPKTHGIYCYFLQLANIYGACIDGIYSKLAQVKHYNWLTEDMVNKCISNLSDNLGKETLFQVPLGYTIDAMDKTNYFSYDSKYGLIKIQSCIDAMDDKIVWEFKCVSEIQMEHLVQLVLYAWIWNSCGYERREFRILNIRSGEVRVMDSSCHLIQTIVDCLIDNKYGSKERKPDDEFLRECRNSIKSFIL